MNEHWILIGRYVAVIITCMLLGATLGHMELFEKTTVVSGKLAASHLVRFLGYSGALAVFWLTMKRLTVLLAHLGGRWNALTQVVLPFGALVGLSIAYSVVLIVVGPLMNSALSTAYNWLFIVATVAAAVWLIVAMFNQSSSLTELIIRKAEKEDKQPPK